jgi:hypothetical protein
MKNRMKTSIPVYIEDKMIVLEASLLVQLVEMIYEMQG